MHWGKRHPPLGDVIFGVLGEGTLLSAFIPDQVPGPDPLGRKLAAVTHLMNRLTSSRDP